MRPGAQLERGHRVGVEEPGRVAGELPQVDAVVRVIQHEGEAAHPHESRATVERVGIEPRRAACLAVELRMRGGDQDPHRKHRDHVDDEPNPS